MRRAIASAEEAGAVVTLVTGRMFRSAIAATSELDITSPIVSFQGAHVADPKTGEVLHHLPLEPHMSIRALDALDGWPNEILAYIGDDVVANVLTPWVEAYSERNRGGVRVVSDLRTLAHDEPTRLAVLGAEDEIGELDRRLNEALDGELYVTRSLPTLCEILHPGGGKRSGLQWARRPSGDTPRADRRLWEQLRGRRDAEVGRARRRVARGGPAGKRGGRLVPAPSRRTAWPS